MLAIAKSSSSGDVAERSHTPPAPALRAEKSSTAASCRGGRSPASTSTGGRSPRPGQPRVGARACVLNVAGNAGRDISDGEVRRAGSSHLSVSSIYIMTIQSVRALAPPQRGVSALGPGEPPLVPRTKPGNTTKLGSSYETEQGRNGKITDVLSHDGLMHVMIASEPSGLCLVTCHRAPATRPATHAGHARSTC